MASRGMSELAIRWHHLRRNQRLDHDSPDEVKRRERYFVVYLLESTTPKLVTETLEGLTDDAINTLRLHLQEECPYDLAEIRYIHHHYDFDPGSPEEIARQERFAATASTILAVTEGRE